MFKVIDNHLVGLNKNIKTFSVAASSKVTRLVDCFNDLKMSTGLTTKAWDRMTKGVEKTYGQNAADYLRGVAKQGDAARASVDGFYAALVQDIPTHGFRNVQAVISQYNSLDSATQNQFAQAIGLTNRNLGNYLTNLDGAKGSMAGYGAQLVATTAKTIGLQAATMLLNAGIGLVISWAISGIMKLVNRQKEAREAALEAAEAAKQEAEEIRDLYKRYSEAAKAYDDGTSSKSDYIEATDALLEKLGVEKSEVKELVEQYGNLSNAINAVTVDALREKVGTLNVAADARRDEFIEAFKKNGKNMFGLLSSKWTVDQMEYDKQVQALVDANNAALISKLEDLAYNPFLGDKTEEYAKEYLATIDELIRKIEERYGTEELISNDYYKDLVNIRNNLDEAYKEYNSAIKEINKNAAEMVVKNALIGGEIPKTKEAFDEFYKSILKADIEGDNWKTGFTGGVEEAKKAVENALRSMPEFVEFFSDDLPNSTNDAQIALHDLSKTIVELGEQMEDFIDTAEKFGDAIGKIMTGEGLEFKEIFELLQLMPQLAKDVEKVAGGKFTIDPDILFDAALKYGSDNNPLEKTLSDVGENVTKIKEQLKDLEKTDVRGAVYAQAKDALEKKLAEEQETYDGLKTFIDTFGDTLDATVFDVALDGAKDKIGDFNDEIEKLQSAIEKMNDDAALSYDEIIELVELFPKMQFTGDEEKGYRVAVESLEEFKEAAYAERDAFIQSQIEKTQALIEETKKQVEIKRDFYEKLAAIDKSIGDGTESEYAKNAKKALDDLEETLEKYEGANALLNAMLGKLYDNAKDDAENKKDILQDQIDYYDTLVDAIEAVTDKQIEALENEKDKLEEQKDALKEANDERQRELDLIEARNNLENAKKRKVYVYSEGKGFQQVQDKKAVKEAEEAVKKAEFEIQEADIDKQIDKLDEQIKSFEDYKEQFTDMKSDIEDLIAIEKAKNALQLDEQGLLNLPPETVKEIQEGMVNSVLEKDKEDNKDNTEYQKFGKVTADEILRRLGSPLTFDEFQMQWYSNTVSPSPFDYSAMTNNAGNTPEIYNNSTKNVSFAPNITVNGGKDAQEIADIAVKEMEKVFQSAYNSIK